MSERPNNTQPSDTPPLSAWIQQQIRVSGPVPFARFMEWALYHPEHGYYSRGPAIGVRGDFTTSPEASPAFGRVLARHVSEIDALLGQPSHFHVVEAGPGTGTLAADLLGELAVITPTLLLRLSYWLMERSSGLAARQRDRLLPEYEGLCTWAESLDDLPRGLTGALIANEVLDAFPVHVLENVEGTVMEHFVGLVAGEPRVLFLEPSDARLLDFLARNAITLHPGERVEINLQAEEWINRAAHNFDSAVATIIDYGDTAPARYSPTRKEGTLLGYFNGAVTDNVLARPGLQDLTALLDFTALQNAALSSGFSILGLTRQANFLLGLGLGTVVSADEPNASLPDVLANRRGIQALVSPEGLGKFHVLLLGKSVNKERAVSELSGLRYAHI